MKFWRFSERFVYNAAIIFVSSTNTNVCVVMSVVLARLICHDLVCGPLWKVEERKRFVRAWQNIFRGVMGQFSRGCFGSWVASANTWYFKSHYKINKLKMHHSIEWIAYTLVQICYLLVYKTEQYSFFCCCFTYVTQSNQVIFYDLLFYN